MAEPRGAGPVDAVIVAAMREELRPLRRMLSDAARLPGRAGLLRGWLSGRRVLLAVTGDGAASARAGAAEALSAASPRILIAIGVAGALSSDLRPGEVVAVARVVDERGGAERRAGALGLGRARASVRPAVAVSAARVADSLAEKRRLLALARPQPGFAAVVDLESAAFAESAETAGVPWAIFRAVSDTAEEALPSLLNRALDDGGAIDRGRVVAGLLRQPSVGPVLLGLRRRVSGCAEALAQVVALTLGRSTVA